MLSRTRAFALAGVVAAGALIPLYGDPQNSPVTHPEWARMLLRALDLDAALGQRMQASQAFSTLSWRNSLAYPAIRYMRATGVEIVSGENDSRIVRAIEGTGEVAYPLAVVRGGDYRLRVRLSGDPSVPVPADVRRFGDDKPIKSLAVAPLGTVMGWTDAGPIHLDPGAYTLSLGVPAGTALEMIEVSPPCLTAIEPPDGWKPAAIIMAEEVAVTMVKALDQESELPPSDVALEFSGSDFQVSESVASAASEADPDAKDTAVDRLWLKAGPRGLQAVLLVEIPDPGLYTLSVFGIAGAGQSWLTDGCSKAVLCGTPTTEPLAPRWRAVTTARFSAGRHFFTVVLGRGALIQKVRLERKKDGLVDYVETLKRLGFDVGPEGPITRPKAIEAMHWLKKKHAEVLGTLCGDIILPPDVPLGVQGLPGPATIPGPGVAPPTSGAPPGNASSLTPDPQPGPPTTVRPTPTPTPSTGPGSSPPPASPPPSVAPPSPTPIPTPTPTPTPTPRPSCQPAGSPGDPSPCP